jgi:hypothetical protein
MPRAAGWVIALLVSLVLWLVIWGLVATWVPSARPDVPRVYSPAAGSRETA